MKPVFVDTRTREPGVSNPNIGLYRRAQKLGVLSEFLLYGPALFGIELSRPRSSGTIEPVEAVSVPEWRLFGV